MGIDLERLEGKLDLSEFVERLRRKGVDESIIASAIAGESRGKLVEEEPEPKALVRAVAPGLRAVLSFPKE